jgi:hypothetical protein
MPFIKRTQPTEGERDELIWDSAAYDKARMNDMLFRFYGECRCPRCKARLEVKITEAYRNILCSVPTCIFLTVPIPNPEWYINPPLKPHQVISNNNYVIMGLQEELLWRINAYRQAHGFPQLEQHKGLMQSAKNHAKEFLVFSRSAEFQEKGDNTVNERIKKIPDFQNGRGFAIGIVDRHDKLSRWGELPFREDYAMSIIEAWVKCKGNDSKLKTMEMSSFGVGVFLDSNGDLLICVHFASPTP